MILVGFLVAYDYEQLKVSIPLIYANADKIILGLDKNRKSFTGNHFAFDETFKDWIIAFDTKHKIEWCEDDFYVPELTPMENETRERKMLFDNKQGYDWYIQLDTDEYFIDFKEFIHFLREQKSKLNTDVAVSIKWKTLLKKATSHYYTIGGKMETMTVALSRPVYEYGRNQSQLPLIESDYVVVHDSWARNGSKDVLDKLSNWSHSHDFDIQAFFNQWNKINDWNYALYRYFHPLHAPIWPYLEKVQADSIPALIEHYRRQPPVEQPVPALSWPQKILKKILGI